jgi:hypothetical protein
MVLGILADGSQWEGGGGSGGPPAACSAVLYFLEVSLLVQVRSRLWDRFLVEKLKGDRSVMTR